MGLGNLFKPKYMHKDKKVRLKAVKKLDKQEILIKIAQNDVDSEVRREAIKKLELDFYLISKDALSDQALKIFSERLLVHPSYEDYYISSESSIKKIRERFELSNDEIFLMEPNIFLADIIKNDYDTRVRRVAFSRIYSHDFFIDIAKNDHDYYICKEAISRIGEDIPALVDISRNASNSQARLEAGKKLKEYIKDLDEIDDDFVLGEIAKYAEYPWNAPVHKIKNNSVLFDVFKNASHEEVSLEAVKKIDDDSILTDIVNYNSNASFRLEAVKKIRDKSALASFVKGDFSSDIRLEAVKKIDDAYVLSDVALNDIDSSVRLVAVKKIYNGDVLGDVALNDSYSSVRLEAVKKIRDKDILVDVAQNDSDASVCSAAVKRIKNLKLDDGSTLFYTSYDVYWINDESELFKIVKESLDPVAREEALKKISDESVFIYVAQNDSDRIIRSNAVEKISDESVLAGIAKNDPDSFVRLVAVEKISDETVLINIAKHDADSYVRRKAIEKISNESVLADIARMENDRYILECLARQTKLNSTLKTIDSKMPLHKCRRCNSFNYTSHIEYVSEMEGYYTKYHCNDCGEENYKDNGYDFR